MITFVTDNEKKNSPLEDESPDIGLSQKGQPVEKIIEQAVAENEAQSKSENAQNAEKTENSADSNNNSVTEEKIKDIIEKEFSITEHTAKFHKGNLRNGMIMEYDGSLVILGDVNAGAEVKATGNILILGALKGIAHAGCNGNTDAFVFALSLIPVQLRIGNIITRFPDGDSKVNRKPEYAYVEDGKIYVSPFE